MKLINFSRGRAKFNQANFDTHQPNTNLFYSATADRVVNQAQSLSQKLQVIDVTEEDTSAGQVAHYFIRLAPRKS